MSNAKQKKEDAKLAEIRNKIDLLQNAFDTELSLQQPIALKLPEKIVKRIKTQTKALQKLSSQKDKKLSDKKLKEISSKLDAANKDLEMLLWDKRKFEKDLKKRMPNKQLSHNLSTAFVKMRTRMFLMKMRYKKLSKQLNSLNLHLVYGLSSLAKKDTYYQLHEEELKQLRFKPRRRLGEKAAFALMRLRASKLLKLLRSNATDDDIKDKFIASFHRINNNHKDDDIRENRLKRFVCMIKESKADGTKLTRDEIRAEMRKVTA